MANKFKVGDKVTLIANTNGSANKVGDVGEIQKVSSSGTSYEVNVVGGPRSGIWSIEEEILLVAKASATFKVGDKVKIIDRSSSCNKVGDIGFITEMSGTSCAVKVDGRNASGNWHSPHMLELVTESIPTTADTYSLDSKFKKGDKVLVIANTNANNYGVGSIVTLSEQREASKSWRAIRPNGKEGNWLAEKDMRLSDRPDISVSKFAVGVKVKVIANGSSHSYRIGDVYTVESLHAKGSTHTTWKLRDSHGNIGNNCREADMEIVSDAILEPKSEFIVGKWYTSSSWQSKSICKFKEKRSDEFYFTEAFIGRVDKSSSKSWYSAAKNIRLATEEELSIWLPETHPDNPNYMVKKSELKPRFKIGDTVRITGNTNSSVNKVGDIGTVIDVQTNSCYVQVEGRPNYSNCTMNSEMELVTAPSLQTAYNTATIPYVDTSQYWLKEKYLESDTITLQLIVDPSKEPKAKYHLDVEALVKGTLMNIDGERWNRGHDTICPEDNKHSFNFPRSWFKVLGVYNPTGITRPTSYVPTHKTWRVKTRDEMISESIMDSRDDVPSGWAGAMDKYFGRTLPHSFNDTIEKRTYFDYDGWEFHKSQITDRPLPISYNTVSSRYDDYPPIYAGKPIYNEEKSPESSRLIDDLDYLDAISAKSNPCAEILMPTLDKDKEWYSLPSDPFIGAYVDMPGSQREAMFPKKKKLELLTLPYTKRPII